MLTTEDIHKIKDTYFRKTSKKVPWIKMSPLYYKYFINRGWEYSQNYYYNPRLMSTVMDGPGEITVLGIKIIEDPSLKGSWGYVLPVEVGMELLGDEK
jgi:hypothetical protein